MKLHSKIAIDVITLFPEMFAAFVEQGVIRRAFGSGMVDIQFTNPREFASNAYKTVDDRPYGGGPGMVMMAPPLAAAIRACKQRQQDLGYDPYVIYMSPQGEKITQTWVVEQLFRVLPSLNPNMSLNDDNVLPPSRGLVILA